MNVNSEAWWTIEGGAEWDAKYLEGFTIDEVRTMTPDEAEKLKRWGIEYPAGLPVVFVLGGQTNLLFAGDRWGQEGTLLLYNAKNGKMTRLGPCPLPSKTGRTPLTAGGERECQHCGRSSWRVDIAWAVVEETGCLCASCHAFLTQEGGEE